jgi:hypothetical protein
MGQQVLKRGPLLPAAARLLPCPVWMGKGVCEPITMGLSQLSGVSTSHVPQAMAVPTRPNTRITSGDWPVLMDDCPRCVLPGWCQGGPVIPSLEELVALLGDEAEAKRQHDALVRQSQGMEGGCGHGGGSRASG